MGAPRRLLNCIVSSQLLVHYRCVLHPSVEYALVWFLLHSSLWEGCLDLLVLWPFYLSNCCVTLPFVVTAMEMLFRTFHSQPPSSEEISFNSSFSSFLWLLQNHRYANSSMFPSVDVGNTCPLSSDWHTFRCLLSRLVHL